MLPPLKDQTSRSAAVADVATTPGAQHHPSESTNMAALALPPSRSEANIFVADAKLELLREGNSWKQFQVSSVHTVQNGHSLPLVSLALTRPSFTYV